ncbi:hypothetical protein FUMI01_29650, partial [Flavobacterium sp. UMI-01]
RKLYQISCHNQPYHS